MVKSLIAFPIAALLMAAPVAMAQDTGNDGQQSAEEVLDLGTPVGEEEPKLGERYLKEKHGDWTLACIKTEAEKDPCSLVQIMADSQGNPLAEISMFRLKNGGQAVAAATVIVPLETLLPAQLTIAIDGASGKRYNYSFCNPVGCFAQIGLTQSDVDAFKAGNEAILSIVPAPAPKETINLPLSLKGFTAGFELVDVVEN